MRLLRAAFTETWLPAVIAITVVGGIVLGAWWIILGVAVALAVIAHAYGKQRPSRPCPRCGEKVEVGKLDCPHCGFDFGTIGDTQHD